LGKAEPPQVFRRVDYLSPATATGLACLIIHHLQLGRRDVVDRFEPRVEGKLEPSLSRLPLG